MTKLTYDALRDDPRARAMASVVFSIESVAVFSPGKGVVLLISKDGNPPQEIRGTNRNVQRQLIELVINSGSGKYCGLLTTVSPGKVESLHTLVFTTTDPP